MYKDYNNVCIIRNIIFLIKSIFDLREIHKHLMVKLVKIRNLKFDIIFYTNVYWYCSISLNYRFP